MEQWKSKRLEASSQPPVSPQNCTTSIYEALQGFMRYLRDERCASPHTIYNYERDLLHFAARIEDLGKHGDITLVSSEDVRAHMYAMIDRHLSMATVRRALYALGSFFTWAMRWELVSSNPVARITVPRRDRLRDIRALSRRERALIIAAADQIGSRSRRPSNRQASLLVRLMLKTGLRRSEVLDLTWRDICLERRELLVRCGKGRKSRRVPIEDKDLLTRLAELREARQVDTPGNEALTLAPVFVSKRGKRIAYSSFYRLFHRILAAAAISGLGITPHALRHTFGSMLCERGVPVPYVKDLLGHEDIGSTMIYVHSTPAVLRKAVRKLAE